MRLRNRVRAARLEMGLTQAALARRAGIARLTLRRIERDDGYVPWGTVMLAVATALKDAGTWWYEQDGPAPAADKEVG